MSKNKIADISVEAKDAYIKGYGEFLVFTGLPHTDELAAVYFNKMAHVLADSLDTPADHLLNAPKYEYLMGLSKKHYKLAMDGVGRKIELFAHHSTKEN